MHHLRFKNMLRSDGREQQLSAIGYAIPCFFARSGKSENPRFLDVNPNPEVDQETPRKEAACCFTPLSRPGTFSTFPTYPPSITRPEAALGGFVGHIYDLRWIDKGVWALYLNNYS